MERGKVRRGYQGEHRFRLEDLQNEFSHKLTTDQVQKAFTRWELIELGIMPESCENCPFRVKEDKLPKEK